MSDLNILPNDQNRYRAAGFESSTTPGQLHAGQIIVATGRIKVDSSGGGSGTVTEVDTGTGLTGGPITTTGTISLDTKLAPMDTLTGNALKVLRVNAGETAVEYVTPSAGTVTSVSGTANRITSTGGTTPVIDISAAYVGQTSLTTLGTITTGVWNGTTIAVANGGTGQTSYTDGQLLIGNTSGNTLTKATLTQGTGITITNGNGTITIAATGVAGSIVVGTTTITSGTTTRILYDNAGVLGEYTLTGSGTVVVMATAPTFVTSITTPSVLATSNDSGALGASGTAFADLFLASGGVINWAANNSNITHSTGILTVGAGEFRITSANVGTNADSVPTLSSTSTLTNKTLTSPTIQTSPVLAAATNLKFTVPTADPSATGITTNEFNSGYSSTAIGDLVYLDSSATWQKADADASAATYSSMLGIALSVTASGAAATVLLQGFVYAATPFPTFTIGAPIYMSATAGAVTQTAPVTTDSATRIVGYAVHADKMWFNPSNDWITHT